MSEDLHPTWRDTLTRLGDTAPAASIRPDTLITPTTAPATDPEATVLETDIQGANAWTAVVSRSGDSSGQRLSKQVLSSSSDEAWRRPYALKGRLGKGGMGEVVLARQLGVDRDVAIKLLRRWDHPQFQEWFQREARITAQLEHPQVPPVHDAGDDFLVMKHLEGATLATRLGEIGAERAAELLLRICDAIELAHERGLIHRDLKPSNILVADFGQIYVLDWGLAVGWEELRARGGVELCAGTPQYLAPEVAQLDGDRIGPGVDVFGCAAILYACLAGHPPTAGTQATECIALAARGDWLPLPATTPAALVDLLARAMRTDPDERLTLTAFRAELQGWLRRQADEDRARAILAEVDSASAAASATTDSYAMLRHWERRYAEARRLQPALVAASDGERRLRRLQIRKALADGNLGLARHLLRREDLAAGLDAEHRELERAEAERTRRQRRQGRARALLVAAGILILVALGLAIAQTELERAWRAEQRHEQADQLREAAREALQRGHDVPDERLPAWRRAQARIAAARGMAPERQDLAGDQARIAADIATWALAEGHLPTALAQRPLLAGFGHEALLADLDQAVAGLEAEQERRRQAFAQARAGALDAAACARLCDTLAARAEDPVLQAQGRDLLLQASTAPPVALRRAACRALGANPALDGFAALRARLDDPAPAVQEAAVDGLLALDLAAALPLLLPRWDGDLAWTRRNLGHSDTAATVITALTTGLELQTPAHAEAWREASRYFFYIGALDAFDKALRLVPDPSLDDRIRLLRKNSHWHYRDSSRTRPVLLREATTMVEQNFNPEAVRALCNVAWRNGESRRYWPIVQRARREFSTEEFLICAEPCYIIARKMDADEMTDAIVTDVLQAVANGFYDDDPALLDDAARLLGYAGYRDEAYSLASRSAAAFPWVYDLQQRIGEEAADRDRWLPALRAAMRMARHRPKEAPPWLITSRYWSEVHGDEDRSLRQLRIGLGYQPRLGDLLIAHGHWLRRNGRPKAALSRFVRAGEMLPGNAGALLPWFELANELGHDGARFAALYEMGYRTTLFPEWCRDQLHAELLHHGLQRAAIACVLDAEPGETLTLRDHLAMLPGCRTVLPPFEEETLVLLACRQACRAVFSGDATGAAAWLAIARTAGQPAAHEKLWIALVTAVVSDDTDTIEQLTVVNKRQLLRSPSTDWHKATVRRWAAGLFPRAASGHLTWNHDLLRGRAIPTKAPAVHPEDRDRLVAWLREHQREELRPLADLVARELPTDPAASRETIDEAHARLMDWPDWDWPVMDFASWDAGGRIEPAWEPAPTGP